jgi:very-short-patch-repair endonuclease
VVEVSVNSSHKARAPLDAALARLAARQHGIGTIAQLLALGMSRSDVAYRVRIGRLYRIHRGVYAVGRPDLTERGFFISAVLAIGDGAVLSHESGTALWGFRPATRNGVDVTVARRRAQRPGIRLHVVRAFDPADVTWRDGIPVTTPARTLLDLAGSVPLRQARRAVNEALVQRKVTVPLLYRQLEHATGRRGGAALRSLIADAAPTRSVLEDVTLEFFERHGLPRPQTNVKVAGWEVDFLFPGPRLVIEADSAQFHDNPISRAEDARKQAALEAAGYRVVRLRWNHITRDEHVTARRLARICAPPTSRAA